MPSRLATWVSGSRKAICSSTRERRIDSRSTQIMRDVLAVFNTLARANTTPMGVGDIVNYFPQISDSGTVTVSMDGRNGEIGDQAVVKYVGTPVPVISSAARMGWRQMAVVRKGGVGLDVETIANHQRKVAEKLALETDLRRAIAEGQLSVHFQPIFQLEPYRISGFEALARWVHPQRGSISRNPCDGVRTPKQPRLLPKALTLDQTKALLEAAPGTSLRASLAAEAAARLARLGYHDVTVHTGGNKASYILLPIVPPRH